MKFRQKLGLILMLLSIIAILCCLVATYVIMFQNPDMTDARRLIEYPQPTIGFFVACGIIFVGYFLLMKGEHK